MSDKCVNEHCTCFDYMCDCCQNEAVQQSNKARVLEGIVYRVAESVPAIEVRGGCFICAYCAEYIDLGGKHKEDCIWVLANSVNEIKEKL